MACAGRSALALALVFTAGCGDDGGGTDGDTDSNTGSNGSTSAPLTSTDPTTEPTTTTTAGEESSGSESGSDESGAPAVDYMEIQLIWDTRCVAGCHIESGIAQTSGPILTAEKSYAEIVDAASKTVPGIVQVKAGDVDASYLWHKINGTQANVGGLGLKMPLGGMLSAEDLAKIEAWINAGAKP